MGDLNIGFPSYFNDLFFQDIIRYFCWNTRYLDIVTSVILIVTFQVFLQRTEFIFQEDYFFLKFFNSSDHSHTF